MLAAVLILVAALLGTGCAPAPADPIEISDDPTHTPTPAASPTPTRTPVAVTNGDEAAVPPLATTSALEEIREREAVRVGVLYNYLPLAGLADNGEVQGYEAALIRKIAERWGVEVEFVQVTRQTRLPMLNSGEVDLLAAAVPHTREMEQLVEFSNTTFLGGYAVLVRSDTAEQGISILANGAIGAVGQDSADVVAAYAEQADFEPAVQIFSTDEEAAQALADVAVNSVVGRREQLMLHAQSEGMDLLAEYIREEPYAFAVRRGDVALRDLLDLTLQDIIAAGELGAVFSTSFFGQPADVFPERLGEPAFTFEDFPAELSDTQAVMERIQQGGALRVAGLELAEQYGPFDSRSVYDGYSRAVINEMARRWQVPVEEIPQSAGQAGLDRLEAGEADIVVGLRSDRSLVGRVALSQPYFTRGLRVIHMEDVAIRNVLDLELKPAIAAPPVDESQDIIEDNNQLPRVTAVESFDEAYETLRTRAVYAIVGDEYALVMMAQQDEEMALVDERYRPREHAMALPRHDPDFLALVNFTLQDMLVDGTLDELREQYFGPLLPEDGELDELDMEIWPGDASYLGVGAYAE